MSLAVQEMFDGIAHKYDFMNHFLSLNRDKSWRSMAIRKLGALDRAVVYDLCGGTGDFQAELLQKNPHALTLVGDFSNGMLSVSKEKFPTIPAIQLDAMKLPFGSDTADIVLNAFGMRNLDSTEQGLAEVARVLKSGGKMATLEFFKPETIFTKFFYLMGLVAFPVLGKLFAGGKASAYYYLAASVRKYLSVREYTELASKQGLVLEQMVPCDFGIAWLIILRKKS